MAFPNQKTPGKQRKNGSDTIIFQLCLRYGDLTTTQKKAMMRLGRKGPQKW